MSKVLCQSQHWNANRRKAETCGNAATTLMTWTGRGGAVEYITLCERCRIMHEQTPPENEAERQILATVRFSPVRID